MNHSDVVVHLDDKREHKNNTVKISASVTPEDGSETKLHNSETHTSDTFQEYNNPETEEIEASTINSASVNKPDVETVTKITLNKQESHKFNTLPEYNPQIDEAHIIDVANSVKNKGKEAKRNALSSLLAFHKTKAINEFIKVTMKIRVNAAKAKAIRPLLQSKLANIQKKISKTDPHGTILVSKETPEWNIKAYTIMFVMSVIGVGVSLVGVNNVAQIILSTVAFVDKPFKAYCFGMIFLLPAAVLHGIYEHLDYDQNKKKLFMYISISGLLFFGAFLVMFGYNNASQMMTYAASLFDDAATPQDTLLFQITFILQLLSEALLGSACFMSVSLVWQSHGGEKEFFDKSGVNPKYEELEDKKGRIQSEIKLLEDTSQTIQHYESMRDAKIDEMLKRVSIKFNEAVSK